MGGHLERAILKSGVEEETIKSLIDQNIKNICRFRENQLADSHNHLFSKNL